MFLADLKVQYIGCMRRPVANTTRITEKYRYRYFLLTVGTNVEWYSVLFNKSLLKKVCSFLFVTFNDYEESYKYV